MDASKELLHQIKTASKQGQSAVVIGLIQELSLEPNSSLDQLRALESQLRLRDAFKQTQAKLADLHKIVPASTQDILSQLSSLHTNLENLLTAINVLVNDCIEAIRTQSLATTSIIAALNNPTVSKSIMDNIAQEKWHTEDWLVERASITYAALQDNLGDLTIILEEIVNDMDSNDQAGSSLVDEVNDEVTRALESTQREVLMAVNGLEIN